MRLWHYQLLPFLPRLQLFSQKKECDLIWKDIKEGKQTNHILINYIWKVTFVEHNLGLYYAYLKQEFDKRGYKFTDNSVMKNANCDLYKEYIYRETMPFKEHNIYYLLQCYFNLEEKFYRGQKDFSEKEFEKLFDFVNEYTDGALISVWNNPKNSRS